MLPQHSNHPSYKGIDVLTAGGGGKKTRHKANIGVFNSLNIRVSFVCVFCWKDTNNSEVPASFLFRVKAYDGWECLLQYPVAKGQGGGDKKHSHLVGK